MLKFSGGAIVPGVSRARHVHGTNELPRKVDVVVIGGGLVGCLTALNLIERGVSVALCEKGVIAGEASGTSAGIVEYESQSSVKLELIARSIELWRGMANRINGDIGYIEGGMVTLYDDETHAESAATWLESVAGQPGVQARMLSKEEIKKLNPNLGSAWHSALFQANGAAIEPSLAAPAIAEATMEKGAKILQHCAVCDIELETGRISGVVTENGSIKTSNVVIAGGVWSQILAQQLGLKLPQLMIFAEMISAAPLAGGPGIPGMTPAGYFRPEPDGGYMFGTATGVVPITPTVLRNLPKLLSFWKSVDQEVNPVLNLSTFGFELRANKTWLTRKPSIFEKFRILRPEVIGKTSNDTYEGMRKHIPAFKNSRVRERYAGALMSSIDNIGVISAVNSIPGLYLGTGMLYGLTLSAAAGEVLADMITGESPKVDISPYHYERLIDGSKLKFHA